MNCRRRYTLGAAISLLIGLATVTLWVRTYFKAYDITGSIGEQLFFVDIARGAFEFGWDTNYDLLPGFHFDAMDADGIDTDLDHNVAGFGYTYKTDQRTSTTQPSTTFRVINIPSWSITLMCAAGFIYCVRHGRAKFADGCCRRCGYELTGNQSGTCPECGISVYQGIVD